MTLAEQDPADFPRSSRLARKFHEPKYRHSYVAAHTRRFLARQMRRFRGEIAQTAFGDLVDKRQTVISRLEDPSYVGWSLRTMLEIARKLDLAVVVRFVDFPTFLRLSEDMSDAALCPAKYDQQAIDEVAREDERMEGESALEAFWKIDRNQSPPTPRAAVEDPRPNESAAARKIEREELAPERKFG